MLLLLWACLLALLLDLFARLLSPSPPPAAICHILTAVTGSPPPPPVAAPERNRLSSNATTALGRKKLPVEKKSLKLIPEEAVYIHPVTPVSVERVTPPLPL